MSALTARLLIVRTQLDQAQAMVDEGRDATQALITTLEHVLFTLQELVEQHETVPADVSADLRHELVRRAARRLNP